MVDEQKYLDLKEWLEETKDIPLEGMASFFDQRIDSYEEHMNYWKEHYKWMANLIPLNCKTVLDLGCGTGLELDYIFKRFPAINVTGIDLSSEMLAALKLKHGDKELSLIQQDYFLAELGENQYDAVISFETLHHFTKEKKKSLFKKIVRSLKKGGTYLECDYIATSQQIEDLMMNELIRRRKRDGISDETFVHFDIPLTLEHELEALRDSGFSKVELIGFLEDEDNTAMIRAIK